jgi:hypothetical protein
VPLGGCPFQFCLQLLNLLHVTGPQSSQAGEPLQQPVVLSVLEERGLGGSKGQPEQRGRSAHFSILCHDICVPWSLGSLCRHYQHLCHKGRGRQSSSDIYLPELAALVTWGLSDPRTPGQP